MATFNLQDTNESLGRMQGEKYSLLVVFDNEGKAIDAWKYVEQKREWIPLEDEDHGMYEREHRMYIIDRDNPEKNAELITRINYNCIWRNFNGHYVNITVR